MSFRDAYKRRMEQEQEPEKEPIRPLKTVRDWYSASGTGWGPNHDQPNPFARAWRRLKRDVIEAPQDFRDEPTEALSRLKARLDWYIKGENQ